jgi:hypothetical protein
MGRVSFDPAADPEKARARVNCEIAKAFQAEPDFDPFNAIIIIRPDYEQEIHHQIPRPVQGRRGKTIQD